VGFDAVILAGGRSSRLGGVPKSGLMYDGETLLARALSAAQGQGATVVVGPDPGSLPTGVLRCREDPPYSGPAAAIAAGLAALAEDLGDKRSPATLILACDMPHAATAVGVLRRNFTLTTPAGAGAAEPAAGVQNIGGRDGVMAVTPEGRKQPLAGLYRTDSLHRAVKEARQGSGLTDASVFSLLARLDVRLITVPSGSTDDVDTWDDAAALGVSNREQ
jgi:molybdopterin-guanine dinucleotide biosynthesis protein A